MGEPAWHHTVVDAVLARAARSSERTAVSAWDGRLTYGELERTTAWLAAQLPPRARVALWVDRGHLLPVALLAAMRAGAVFAVLDPAQPDARTLGCLDVLRPELLVRVAPARPLPPAIAARVRVLEIDAAGFDAAAVAHPAPGAADPAYVLFTSGTTGVPKAILTDHAPLAHFLDWQARTFELGPDDRVSVVSGLAHDPLLRDLFAPLAAGGTACIPAQASIREPEELRRFLRDEGVTVVHLTPALAQLLCEGRIEPLPAVRLIFSGGARLRRKDVLGMRALAPGAVVVNVYGTSETPQVMGHHVLGPDAALEDEIPIGRPIEHVELIVLDDGGVPAPPGMVGEILVKTPFLSRGYLDDPALTRERYSRLGYHTGDLGVVGPDGLVRYRGRKDDQLKVASFRVEPAEIEAALLAHPDVVQAVVAPSIGPDDDWIFVAYVVTRAPVTERDLRAFATERLPGHMIPSRFVSLPALPLTPNGKVDKRALPAPPPLVEVVRAARSPLEEKVVDAWTRVLGRTPDLDDDFFATGGTSLLALRMLNQLEASTGVRLPMRALLGASTPATLAARFAAPDELPAETVILLRPGGPGLPIFVLPGGGGISVLGFRDFANLLDVDRPVYGLEVPVKGVTEQLPVEERAADFVREIRRVQPRGPYHLLGFSLGSWIAFEMARQLEAAGEDVKFLAVFDTHCRPRQLRSRVDDVLIRAERYRHAVRKFLARPPADKVKYLAVLGKAKAIDVQEWSMQKLWEVRDRVQRRPPTQALAVDDIDKGARLLLRRYSETFAPAPIRAPLTIILADNTSFAGVDPARDPRLGWRHFTTGGIDVHTVPGSHLGMMIPPNLAVTAGVISRCIAKVVD